MTSFPYLDKNLCTGCRLCISDCVAKAINPVKMEISQSLCIRCGHCYAICPTEAIVLDGETGLSAAAPSPALSSDLTALIRNRRSIRHYREECVDREKIGTIAETACYAPTGTNSRMTGTIILDNRENIRELTDILMRHFTTLSRLLLNRITYPLFVLFIGKDKTQRIFNYKKVIPQYWNGTDILTHDAPLLMIFHSDRNSSTPDQDGVIRATTAMFSAESLGLGTCFNGFLVIGINSCRKAREYLGLKKGQRVCETFTAGYPRFRYVRTVPPTPEDVRFI